MRLATATRPYKVALLENREQPVYSAGMSRNSQFHFVLAGFAFVIAALATAAGGASAGEQEPAFRIELVTIATGPADFYYMQSRGTLVPGDPPRTLITTQEIEKTGSHGFRDIFQLESRDGGQTWSPPVRIESLGRITRPNGDDFVAGDLCPQWHAATGVVLTTGKTFTFHGGTREDRTLERVSYAVFDPKVSAWTDLQLLDLPAADHQGRPILQPNSGCCQRHDLQGGEILLPIRYSTLTGGQRYTTIVARCRFDGRRLTYIRHGSELSLAAEQGRGLYEPSLTAFRQRFYLTLRADKTGYVTRSDDGLDYEPITEWKFDDGSPLGNYNTQQHWVSHEQGLFLVYTRRGANNDHVFRHRAPLFIAQVDPERLCIVRATEQVLVPENHADLGNFGVFHTSPRETWVVTSEGLTNTRRQADRSRILAAKLMWTMAEK